MKLQPVKMNFSLRDHVYERLKDAITEMDIYSSSANLRLDERSLADQLNVSRTPLRDALTRLEVEGLVSIVPRKGIYVLRKSQEEVLEMIVAWAALESMAARLATEWATDAEIASLRKIASKYDDEVSETRIAEYSDYNIRFHLRILEISHCSLLKKLAEDLFLHMKAIRKRALKEADRVKRSVVDHAEIIEALEERNADEAAIQVREHTMRLHEHIRRTWTRLDLTGKGNVKAG